MSEIKINITNNTKAFCKGNFEKGYYMWHDIKTFEIEGNSYHKLICSDSFGGCGMQQLYGWINVASYFENSDALIKKYLETKHCGVGLVICQVGQSYYGSEFEKALINNGFEETIKYDNLQHGVGYTQKIYTKTFIE